MTVLGHVALIDPCTPRNILQAPSPAPNDL